MAYSSMLRGHKRVPDQYLFDMTFSTAPSRDENHAIHYVVEGHNHKITKRPGLTPLCLIAGDTTDVG